MKSKLLTSLFLTSALSLSLSIGLTACSTNSQENNQNSKPEEVVENFIEYKRSQFTKRNANENLYADAQLKAKDTNNVLFYDITWSGVLHRNGSLLHLLSVLQNNPNKTVYVYVNSDGSGIKQTMVQPIIDSKKFPNLKVINIAASSINSYKFNSIEIANEMYRLIQQNKEIDFYIDDFRLLLNLTSYLSYINNPVKLKETNQDIIQHYSFLGLSRSLNIIADGTHSWSFWDKGYYDLMKLTDNIYDVKTHSYPLSNKIRAELRTLNPQSKLSFANHPYSGMLILQSLFSAFSETEDNKIQASKYFVAGTDTILDINSTGSMLPETIKKSGFDPYYCVDASIIQSYRQLTKESRELFLKGFNVTLQSKDILNNKKSVIYSGRLTADGPAILNDEAQRIINLYKLNGGLTDSNVQVLFKGHPRDSADYKTNIINKITELEPTIKPEAWLHFLDKALPMEYYVLDGFLTPSASPKRDIVYYSGYSTLLYFMESDNLSNVIKNVIVSDNDMKNILKWNGYPSRLFPKGKLIGTNDLIPSPF